METIGLLEEELQDPQQEIFTAIRKAISDLGYAVYDGELPPEETPYPFVYLGYTKQIDQETKTQIIGRVIQQVDVWHESPRRRGDLSLMMLKIKQALRRMSHTTHFSINITLQDQDIDDDKTTGHTLMRGILFFVIEFS